MSATDPNAQPSAEPTNQPPAQPTVPPASPQAETDTAGGTGRGRDRDVAPRRLTRSREDRMLTGVCGGLAQHLGLDPTLVRVLVVLATVMGAGIVAVVYVIAAVVMPEADPVSDTVTVTAPR